MRLALQLLTYNRPETLPALFNSLAAQTDKNWILFVLDNSTDQVKAAEIAALIEQQKERLHLVFERSIANMGFDGGHQHLYEKHSADYVMCVNDDVILEPEYVESVTRALDENPKAAAASGTILRWNFASDGADGVRSGIWDVVKSDVIDSLGLKRTPWHSVHDIGAGRTQPPLTPPWKGGERSAPRIVWGVSGCLPTYRRSAVGAQLFDPAYFMYKEDVDLAYRFAKAGWTSLIVPSAIAYHRRTFSWQSRREPIPFFTQWLSYRNHLRNLRKHLTWKDWLMSGWLIVPYEVAKFGYLCYNYRTEFLKRLWKDF